MASIGDVTRPAFAYDQATDTWVPVGIGPHSHTASGVGAVATSSFAAKGDLLVGTGAGTLVAQTVGANGTVLTANSAQADGVEWAAPASGGMTQIATGSMTGTTVTISSIPTTYKNLQLIIRDPNLSGNADTLRMRFNSNTSSIYGSCAFNNTSAFRPNTSSSFNIGYLSSGADGLICINITDYANTSTFKVFQSYTTGDDTANNQYVTNNDWGMVGITSAVTSVSLFSDSLYTFSAGTYILYGVS
jgi:hypothetical protein